MCLHHAASFMPSVKRPSTSSISQTKTELELSEAQRIILRARIVLLPTKERSRALRLFRCRTEGPPRPLETYHSEKGRCVLSALCSGVMASGSGAHKRGQFHPSG